MSRPEDPRLTLDERAQVLLGGKDPADYVALPVQVQVDQGRQGVIARAPNGETVVVIALVVAIPMKHLKVSRVLRLNGQVNNPVDGMLPTMLSRVVIPRERLTDQVLADLDQAVVVIDQQPDIEA